jgi:hypothetical protein
MRGCLIVAALVLLPMPVAAQSGTEHREEQRVRQVSRPRWRHHGAPLAPPSDFVDMREAPGVARPQIAVSRWNCTACHVPQTNAPPVRRHSSDASGDR